MTGATGYFCLLYWMHLAASVLSYWLYAYKSSLLQAHQRTDVVSKVALLTDTVQYALQILVLVYFKNYYFYVLAALAAQAMANIMTAKAAAAMYPDYKPVGRLPELKVMEIWVGEGLKLEFPAVIYFCVYYFVYELYRLLNTYKDAAGIWHEDRFRPIVMAVANLGMNLATVRAWGIYGVILSTVLVGMPWLLCNLFTALFDKSQMVFYVRRLGLYALTAAAVCVACWPACRGIRAGGWGMLAVRGILSFAVSNALFFAVYHKLPEFGQCVRMAGRFFCHCVQKIRHR